MIAESKQAIRTLYGDPPQPCIKHKFNSKCLKKNWIKGVKQCYKNMHKQLVQADDGEMNLSLQNMQHIYY